MAEISNKIYSALGIVCVSFKWTFSLVKMERTRLLVSLFIKVGCEVVTLMPFWQNIVYCSPFGTNGNQNGPARRQGFIVPG